MSSGGGRQPEPRSRNSGAGVHFQREPGFALEHQSVRDTLLFLRRAHGRRILEIVGVIHVALSFVVRKLGRSHFIESISLFSAVEVPESNRRSRRR